MTSPPDSTPSPANPPQHKCNFDTYAQEKLERVSRAFFGNGTDGFNVEYKVWRQNVTDQYESLNKEMTALNKAMDDLKKRGSWLVATIIGWIIVQILMRSFPCGG